MLLFAYCNITFNNLCQRALLQALLQSDSKHNLISHDSTTEKYFTIKNNKMYFYLIRVITRVLIPRNIYNIFFCKLEKSKMKP